MNTISAENTLKNESSPYLLQHKDNPIHWKSWNNNVLDSAKKSGKLIFLSIGYSTCHWCHVMEKECFENQEVADFLNKNFISIKVDREQRPDVDQAYMKLVKAISNQSGWPLTAILTPERKVIFGGTYFPKEKLMLLLENISEDWTKNKTKLENFSESILTKISEFEKTKLTKDSLKVEDIDKNFLNSVSDNFDKVNGGFYDKPKFPKADVLNTLLSFNFYNQSKENINVVKTTLDKMMISGIYDHIEGGFHRYTVDEKWRTPHFEKMLYDNALLLEIYSKAYQVFKDPGYLIVIKDIINFLNENFYNPNTNIFFSALDADSENKEGTYYVWKESELKVALTEKEFKKIKKYFDISEKGNFEEDENTFYFHSKNDFKDFHKKAGIKNKLKNIRVKREKPFLDKKQITAWNSLLASAFIQSYKATKDKEYLKQAKDILEYLLKNHFKNQSLYRSSINKKTSNSANLDDYAYLIKALIDLHQVTFDEEVLKQAISLQEIQNKYFLNKDRYFNYSKDKDIIINSTNFYDSARPNSNAVSFENLSRLYLLTYNDKFKEISNQLKDIFLNSTQNINLSYATFVNALKLSITSPKEVVIVSKSIDKKTTKILDELKFNYLPNIVTNFRLEENKSFIKALNYKKALKGKPTIYVCKNQTCLLPTHSIKEMNKQINE